MDHVKQVAGGATAMNRWLAPIGLMAAAVVAYGNSFGGVFLFDDRYHILGERRLMTLWPLWSALRRRRFVVDYSLALNYEIGGENPWGYHFVNLLIHVLAGLTLYGVVRRAFALVTGRGIRDTAATWFAFAVALLWLIHPLQTQSVTYLIQRAESAMGMFYLLTLYCVIRGAGGTDAQSPGRWSALGWYVLAVASCALGMGSKGVMLTAPIVVLAFDRLFLAMSWRGLWRRRWGLYLGLLGTWGVLWMTGVARTALDPTHPVATVGFGYRDVTPWQYLLTQAEVLLTYLRLTVWPHPLSLDYLWPYARSLSEVWPAALVVVVLLALTVWALVRHPWLGFAGFWFFAILGPTSSFVPIKDPIFEHRMYLPLAGVLTILVALAYWVIRRALAKAVPRTAVRAVAFAIPLLLVGASLTIATIRRNAVYQSEAAVWFDVLKHFPDSPRAIENYATALLAEGRLTEAREALSAAVERLPNVARVQNAFGFALAAHGQHEEAMHRFERAIELDPGFARARVNLGFALNDMGRRDEARQQFEEAVRLSPRFTDARLNLGNAYLEIGRVDEAVEQYRAILEVDREHASAWGNLGTALLTRVRKSAGQEGRKLQPGDADEALAAWRRALEINPKSYNVYNSMGIALAGLGRLDEAVDTFRRALQLNPGVAGLHMNLALCLEQSGDWSGAAAQYLAAYKLKPGDPNIAYDYGWALFKSGDRAGAISAFEEVLRIQPDHTLARKALEDLRTSGDGR